MNRILPVLLMGLLVTDSAWADWREEVSTDRFAHLALACLHQEYPNKIAHVMSSDGDVAPPRKLTPVFYGCFDWHSSVHGHWLLLRLLRMHPESGFARSAMMALDQSFQAEKVATEVEYAMHEQRAAFERPYGIAWFLQLMAELREWDEPLAAKWREALEPLESVYVGRLKDWLPKLAYPIRIGEHAQTAFAFALFLDWADTAGDLEFLDLVRDKSRQFYLGDVDCPMDYEPGGQDFLSPCLAEADLMRRVLAPQEYAGWLGSFLPGIPRDGSPAWLPLAVVTDRSDGKLAHLDGLHLARAWALDGMAAGLPDSDSRRGAILGAAREQGEAGLVSVTGEHYEGGHWLGSFATYLVTRRGAGKATGPGNRLPLYGESQAAVATMRSRMALYESELNAVIALNPGLEAQAMLRDQEKLNRMRKGPLHGLPVLVKDNIETRDQATTAGSIALENNDTGRDAPLVARLREAGLLIAGKTNLSEWANMRDSKSTSGWSAVGGQTRNPWGENRNPCGSSSGSGVAVAAAYVPFAVGTETSGSIICPAAYNGVVGIKPTVGLVSRTHVVPISASQDTAGPMAYSVKAAALLLSAMEGPDDVDPATSGARAFFGRDYLSGLTGRALQGLRIGVIRSKNFADGSDEVFSRAVQDLAANGAVLIDDLKFPEWPEMFWDRSYDLLLYEFKDGLNRYFASLPGEESKLTLSSLIGFNERNRDVEMPWFGQSVFHDAQAKGGLDSAEYRNALDHVQTFTRSTIDTMLAEHELDVLVAPSRSVPGIIDLVLGDYHGGGTGSMAAISGYPHITVPMGRVKGLPVGISFLGAAFSEPVLIRAAYGYEQATRHGTTLAGPDPWGLEKRWSEQAGEQGLPFGGIIREPAAIPGLVAERTRCEIAGGEQGESQACQ